MYLSVQTDSSSQSNPSTDGGQLDARFQFEQTPRL